MHESYSHTTVASMMWKNNISDLNREVANVGNITWVISVSVQDYK